MRGGDRITMLPSHGESEGLGKSAQIRELKKPIRGLIQMFVGTTRIRQMSDEVSVQLVDVDASEIVNFLTSKAEYFATRDHCDMDTLTIQYFVVHNTLQAMGQSCARWPAIARQIACYVRP